MRFNFNLPGTQKLARWYKGRAAAGEDLPPIGTAILTAEQQAINEGREIFRMEVPKDYMTQGKARGTITELGTLKQYRPPAGLVELAQTIVRTKAVPSFSEWPEALKREMLNAMAQLPADTMASLSGSTKAAPAPAVKLSSPPVKPPQADNLDPIVAALDAITDPGQRTEYFRQHRKAIKAAYTAKFDAHNSAEYLESLRNPNR
jgi:hypothetical protein